jgi:GT2 family glycosyltransferase
MVLDPGGTSQVDWVSGVSMLFRGEVFSTTGCFDEGFFLYFEEIDLARRVNQSGWKVYFKADVETGHIGALATNMRDETRRMPRYWFESRRRYLVKHHGRLYAAACDAAWLAGHAILKFKMAVQRQRHLSRPHLGRDFLRYSATNALKFAPEAEQNRQRPSRPSSAPPREAGR